MRNDCVKLYIHLLYGQNCNGTTMLKVYPRIPNEGALISPCRGISWKSMRVVFSCVNTTVSQFSSKASCLLQCIGSTWSLIKSHQWEIWLDYFKSTNLVCCCDNVACKLWCLLPPPPQSPFIIFFIAVNVRGINSGERCVSEIILLVFLLLIRDEWISVSTRCLRFGWRTFLYTCFISQMFS